MNQEFILGKLSEIMAWDTGRAREEFGWLRLMSRMKYDGYQDFLAGARFIESLADWLQQFAAGDREAAYGFVRSSVVYISTAEMNHLVELFYPDTVVWRIQTVVAHRLRIPRWQVWATAEAQTLFERLKRQTLFIELSDGARGDVFRRANAGYVSNEQVVTAPRFNLEKADDLLADLRSDLQDPEARFAFVFVIDDFVGSGTTLLRQETAEWKGKLPKLWLDVQGFRNTHFESDWCLCVHHYLATHSAAATVQQRNQQILEERGQEGWFRDVQFSFGAILPSDLPLTTGTFPDFLSLAERYYDKSLETSHTRKGGADVRLGFGGCALPLVLEHNTPNNSVALLWADTPGEDGRHAMRPLFRRRQRHV